MRLDMVIIRTTPLTTPLVFAHHRFNITQICPSYMNQNGQNFAFARAPKNRHTLNRAQQEDKKYGDPNSTHDHTHQVPEQLEGPQYERAHDPLTALM